MMRDNEYTISWVCVGGYQHGAGMSIYRLHFQAVRSRPILYHTPPDVPSVPFEYKYLLYSKQNPVMAQLISKMNPPDNLPTHFI
jgi:hypothetical protein